MRITPQLLRSKAKRALLCTECLDLSNLGIDAVERLQSCSKLHTLNLCGNNIDYVDHLECCQEIWKIDLGNNKIKHLDGFLRFVALGTLNLCNNDLCWSELAKIRHMHILDLSLHGNPQLEKDSYYRIHVIDCLPHVWMLDGRIITSAERQQVKHFFQDSALTDHPVRHKLSKEKFKPSGLKKVEVNGVFGEKTTHLMTRFPVNGALNIATDKRRLKYLAFNLQRDLLLEKKYDNTRDFRAVVNNKTFLEDLVSIRHQEIERCNMILLLTVASLEFAIPTYLMKQTLETAKLTFIGSVYTMDLFFMPRDVRCSIASILLSAVKVDKDMGEEGGLYDRLYLALYNTVSELTKLGHRDKFHSPKKQSKTDNVMKEAKALIASEVVQLMCIVHSFFDFLDKDVGVMNLVSTATADFQIIDKITKLQRRLANNGALGIYEETADFIMNAIQNNTRNMLNKALSRSPSIDYVLKTRKSIPRRPQSSPIYTSTYLTVGRTSPDRKPPRIASGKAYHHQLIRKFPNLGDMVLLGPQSVARIISLPEADIALLQMESVQTDTCSMTTCCKNSEEHYTYIDMNQMWWDQAACYWRPQGTIGDRITMQLLDELERVDDTELDHRHDQQNDSKHNTPHSSSAVPSGADTPCVTAASKGLSPRPHTAIGCGPRNLVQEANEKGMVSLKNEVQEEEEMPRAVSAMLMEQLNLKLDMSAGSPIIPKEPPLASVIAEGHNCVKNPAETTSQDPEDMDALHLSSDHLSSVGLYDALKGAIHFLETKSGTFTPPAKISEIEDYLIDRRHDEPQTAGYAGDTGTITPHLVVSRRSSLESMEEIELQHIYNDSRPGTAHSKKSHGGVVKSEANSRAASAKQDRTLMGICEHPGCNNPIIKHVRTESRPGTGRSDKVRSRQETPIEIPYVKTEHHDDERVTTVTGDTQPSSEVTSRSKSSVDVRKFLQERKTGDHPSQSYVTINLGAKTVQEGSVKQNIVNMSMKTAQKGSVKTSRKVAGDKKAVTERVPYSTSTPRPISAYKMVVAQDSTVTSYQQERTDAWKRGTLETSSKALGGNIPPPQRPSSPISGSEGRKSLINVKFANDWLAAGRNLHWEEMRSRPKSGHMPGWMDGMLRRPRSSAASRAMKRSRVPFIMTPSSMAYERSYASSRNSEDAELLDYPCSPTEMRSPTPTYGIRSIPRNSPLSQREGIVCVECIAAQQGEGTAHIICPH